LATGLSIGNTAEGMEDLPELTRRALLKRAAAAGIVIGTSGAAGAQAHPRRRHRQRRRRPAHATAPNVRATFGTELEYYRSDPDHLEQRLALCAAAGYTTIQTYVPWNVHENTQGQLDFSGRTKPVIVHDHVDEYQIETPDQEIAAGGLPGRVIANTDLFGFIEACVRHGFELLLRPGPFISDEWRNGGLPDWLLLAHPNMFQLGPHGSALEPGLPFAPPAEILVGGGPLYYFAGPSYAADEYLAAARRWMTSFAAAVKPYLHSSGGPVTSMQVDDEICFYYRFGPFEVDYHPAMLARFGSSAPTDWPAPGGPPSALLPALRWQRFKSRQLGVFLADMAAALRAGGADVPISHEEELQLSPPASLAEIAGSVDVLHPEFYLDPGPWSQPTLELCAAAMRAAQRGRRDVISAEMSQGDVFIRHLLLGEGVSGFVGFSYTQGIPEDAVADMGVLGRTLRLAGPRLARFDRVADTAIVWCPEYLYTPYDSTRYGFDRDVRNVIERDIPALATLLIRAGLSFDLLDTDVARAGDYDRYPTVWLVAADVLPRAQQAAVIRYVRRGGRLVCWPAPPTLDENYAPCTLLRDALYNERLGAAYADDGQTISVYGRRVQVWRGVQTFALRSAAVGGAAGAAVAVAMRGSEPAGYSRRFGLGTAILLGTWPVADSVPGREGDVFAIQDAPANAVAPPGAGQPQKVIVFDYSNERRGGEVITGGTVAYWDGENVVPSADINLGMNIPQLTTPPFRPIAPAHLDMARALHGRTPACAVSDRHAQARLLEARDSTAATVSVINRYEVDIKLSILARHRGQVVRLPPAGELSLPAGSALLLPIDWQLGGAVTVVQATVQLLDAEVLAAARTVRLSVSSPGGGELVLQLPSGATGALVDGRPAALSRSSSGVVVAVPAGAHEVEVAWG
jgi:hypothetical protein